MQNSLQIIINACKEFYNDYDCNAIHSPTASKYFDDFFNFLFYKALEIVRLYKTNKIVI